MTYDHEFTRALSAAQAGDHQAIEHLYRSVAPIVRGFLYTTGARDVDDLLGDTIVSVLTKLESFSGNESDFRSWVLTIAYRRYVDSVRKGARRQEDPFDPVELTAWSGRQVVADDAERVALGHLSIGSLLDAVSQLSDGQREVVMLRALADLTVPQIAMVLGKHETAVRALLTRGVRRLRLVGAASAGDAGGETTDDVQRLERLQGRNA